MGTTQIQLCLQVPGDKGGQGADPATQAAGLARGRVHCQAPAQGRGRRRCQSSHLLPGSQELYRLRVQNPHPGDTRELTPRALLQAGLLQAGRSRTGSAGTKEHFIRGRCEGPRPHRVSTASALSGTWALSEGLTQPRLDTGSWAAVGAQSLGKQARLFHPLTLPGAGGGPGGCHWPRGVHFLLAFGSWQSATVALGLTRGCRRPPWAPLLPRPPGCSWGTAGSAPALRRRLLLADLGLGSGHEASSAPLPTTARRLVHLPRL